MNGFEWALARLKEGKAVARQGWGDAQAHPRKRIVLVPAFGLELSYLQLAYPIGHARYPQGCLAPWTPTRCDLLEDDWVEVTP